MDDSRVGEPHANGLAEGAVKEIKRTHSVLEMCSWSTCMESLGL